MSIQNLINFTKFYNKFQQTKRMIYATGENRKENDAEHSYQVALTCWYLISEYKLDLNIELILKYALIHDLPEALTGDYYFEIDKETKNKKDEDEKKAIEDIKDMFPNFIDLPKLLEDYNNLKDEEAKFVNSTEKLIPVINIYLDKGRTWKEEGMTHDVLVSNKDRKLPISDIPTKLWEEFKPILEKSGLLPKNK